MKFNILYKIRTLPLLVENQPHLLKANVQLKAISNNFFGKCVVPQKKWCFFVICFVTYFDNDIPKTV